MDRELLVEMIKWYDEGSLLLLQTMSVCAEPRRMGKLERTAIMMAIIMVRNPDQTVCLYNATTQQQEAHNR